MHIYINIYIYMYVCMYVYICMYVCMYAVSVRMYRLLAIDIYIYLNLSTMNNLPHIFFPWLCLIIVFQFVLAVTLSNFFRSPPKCAFTSQQILFPRLGQQIY